MAKYVHYYETPYFIIIGGFQKKIEQVIEEREPTNEHITLNDVTNMPTFALASLALDRNAPEELIEAMEFLKSRYLKKDNVSNEVKGFFDYLEGKAYGYVALNIPDIKRQARYLRLAAKCFNNAKNKGYVEAMDELADLKNKLGDLKGAIKTVEKNKNIKFNPYERLGEFYFGFSDLVINAVRVIGGKKPIIGVEEDYQKAKELYSEGKNLSGKCLINYALCQIIDGDKNLGISILESTREYLEIYLKESKAKMFNSDYESLRENIDLINYKILKNHTR